MLCGALGCLLSGRTVEHRGWDGRLAALHCAGVALGFGMPLRDTRLGGILLGTAEFLPLIVFMYAGRMGGDISQRFYWGAGVALAVVPLLAFYRWRPNPLLVAVNLWLCVEALVFLVDVPLLTAAQRALAEAAFFVAIILVGAGYIAFSEQGLLTSAHEDARQVRICSLILLALAGVGLVCAFAFRGDETFAAVLPATFVFITQMLMGAYLRDRAAST